LLIDLEALALTAEERELLAHPLVGGVIFFQRNYESRDQLQALVQAIRAIRPELLLTVDQEGGRVQRFRAGFTTLPPPAVLGRRYDQEPPAALALARSFGYVLAAELRQLDVDLSFAPVLDVAGNEEIIGSRALHREPAAIVALAGALQAGMAEAGMAACGKHFPGHGSVRGDSHLMLPRDERPYAAIRDHDLRAFAGLIAQDLAAVMMAHVLYPQVDTLPASFSGLWSRQILRDELGFAGAVICDDLCMQGAAELGDILSRAEAAHAAGCDILPVCNDRTAVITLLDHLRWPANGEAQARVQRLRGRRVAIDPARLQQARQALHDILDETE
jgi:beta-N-acetylhexosaminidase